MSLAKSNFFTKKCKWIKFFIFLATCIDIQDEFILLPRIHKKNRLANIGFEDHFVVFKALFESGYVEVTYAFQCKIKNENVY